MPANYILKGLRFLLTYPQCPHDKADALSLKCAQMGSKRYLVCKELHEDGGQHLHAYVEFPTQQRYTDPIAWDFDGQHGNYQAARSANRAAGYVAKDGDLIVVGFTPAEIKRIKAISGESPSRILGKRLLEGEAVETIFREYPELNLVKDLSKIKANIQQVRAFDPTLVNQVVKQIQIFNLLWTFDPTAKCRGPGGNYHPYIYGKRGCGKSTCIDNLTKEGYRIYYYRHTNGQNANWVGYNSTIYDAICLDDAGPEMLTAIGYDNLNAIMDGRQTWLNTKGGTVLYSKPMPIIIISNLSDDQLFPKRDESTSALLSRLAFYDVVGDPRSPHGQWHPDFPPTARLMPNIF